MNVSILESQLVVHLLLVVCKIAEGSTTVVLKSILASGIHVLLLTLCCQAVGLATLFGVAFFVEGTKKLPLKKLFLLVRLFLIGILSSGSHLLFFQGLAYTSPEFAAVMFCLIPMFASVIAIAFKLEKLKWLRYDGQARIAGITIACLGAVLMSIYKGPRLLNEINNSSLWFSGVAMVFLSCMGVGILINVQTPILREYQAAWSVIFCSSLVSTIITGVTCYFLIDTWSLPSTKALLGILYNGSVGILALGSVAWVTIRVDLLLVCCYSAFQPVVTIIISVIFLGSTIYFGSIVGALLVICGVVLSGWSQGQTKKLEKAYNIEENLIP